MFTARSNPFWPRGRGPFDDGVPAAPPAASRIRVTFRPALASDLAFVLDSWRMSLRKSQRYRRLTGNVARLLFDHTIRRGVLSLDDTVVTVGCDAERPDQIWSWLCHTPGAVPTLHYAVTREATRDGATDLRGLGLFRLGIAAIGVRAELVYTARPTADHAEAHMLDEARKAGITATYHSVEEFLAHRGIR